MCQCSSIRPGASTGQAKGKVCRVRAECIEIIVDSAADESCLPSNFYFYGESLGQDGPGFLDAQENELGALRCLNYLLPQVFFVSVWALLLIPESVASKTRSVKNSTRH